MGRFKQRMSSCIGGEIEFLSEITICEDVISDDVKIGRNLSKISFTQLAM